VTQDLAEPALLSDPSGPGARTLTSAIHARLRADLLACRYRPGEKLLIAPLAKRFRVSLALMREALSRLMADGLVVAEDQRGFRVSPLSLADLHDMTHTRIELECLALRRSMLRGDAAWQAALERAWATLCSVPYTTAEDPGRHHEAWSAAHGKFHAALVSACGLDWLLRFRVTLFERSERYRRLGRALGDQGRDTAGEHRLIFEATAARDVEAAVALLAQHLQRTADAIAAACSDRGLTEQLSWAPER
jgi:DNA-binding GntR family transcriptional regulator